MSLSNYAKNYYIYKLMFLPCAMNYYRCFIYLILVMPHRNSHKNKVDVNIFILLTRLTKFQ